MSTQKEGAIMKNYVVIYHAETDAMEQMSSATPEMAKAGMDAWMAWAESCGSALVDLGKPLGFGKTVSTEGVTDSTKQVCGYSLMQAESTESVLALLKKHPHFMMPGQCSIEVHEALPMAGM
jgi:hypothetical protein